MHAHFTNETFDPSPYLRHYFVYAFCVFCALHIWRIIKYLYIYLSSLLCFQSLNVQAKQLLPKHNGQNEYYVIVSL